MKTIQNIGLVTLMAGMMLFTGIIFSGSYSFDKSEVDKYFEITRGGNGPVISEGFNQVVKAHLAANTVNLNYPFVFNQTLLELIRKHNSAMTRQFLTTDGISPSEIGSLLQKVSLGNGIVYNEALLSSLFSDNQKKKQLLMDNTSWMFEDQRTYTSIEAFKKDLTSKTDQINKNVGQEYYIGSDGGTLLSLTKVFISSKVKSHKVLWFFLTFGLVILGTMAYHLPNIDLLGPAGIKHDGIMQSSATHRGWVGIVVFLYLVTFYIVLYFYPQFLVNNIFLVDPISISLSGNAASHWFLYGFIYCTVMTLMAIRMYIKYRDNKYQILRTTSVLFFQIVFAFLIPELLTRFNLPSYDLKNAFPLDYDFFYAWSIDQLVEGGAFGLFILVWGVILTVVLVPIFVYFFGKRWYCSWVCGCGGLAETLGDPYRQLSNKTLKFWKAERWIVHGVLVFAVVMTAATLYTYFTGTSSLFGVSTYDMQVWYGFLIGSIFAGVIGTGFYPVMGNRVWCRMGCPLAAYLGIVQRFKSRFRITTNGGQCISCGNCSTYCEQGIDVRWYAQRGQNVVRASCVGCGVCSAVCPRGVLKLENGPEESRFKISEMPSIKK